MGTARKEFTILTSQRLIQEAKNFLRSGNFDGRVEKDFYGRAESPFTLLTRKAVTPSPEELDRNPRSRSAKLRAAIKNDR